MVKSGGFRPAQNQEFKTGFSEETVHSRRESSLGLRCQAKQAHYRGQRVGWKVEKEVFLALDFQATTG